MLILSIPLTSSYTYDGRHYGVLLPRKLTGQSGKYFARQQKNLGAVNGYIEEMMDGQKVVKVFCHEEESKEKFRGTERSDCMSVQTVQIHYANLLGPINAQLGNVSYVVCAIVGGVLALNGMWVD